MEKKSPESKQTDNSAKNAQSPGFFSVIFSVLSAFFGVQNDANRERDFQQGDMTSFLIMGVILCILMVIGLIVLVNYLVDSPV